MSMLTQWFFNILFSCLFLLFIFYYFFPCIFAITLHLQIRSRSTASLVLWFVCMFFPPSASVGFKTFPTTQSVKKKQKTISLVFSGDEFALFWLWKCWCCLDCFGLFQQILFSGVKLLISRCVGFFSTGFRFSCLVATNLELGLSLGSNFKFVAVNVC